MIKLPKERIDELTPKIKEYMINEFDLEIGGFEAEFLLDFFNKELSNEIYNKALNDISDEFRAKIDITIEDIVYNLEKQ